MIFAKSVQYSLRIMATVALRGAESHVRAKDIARYANVPESYLHKVLRRMVSAGLLRSDKGHGGGFSLAREASKISFNDILTALNIRMMPKKCVFGRKICSDAMPCVLHKRWNTANEAFLHWASTTTLKDVREDALLAMPPDQRSVPKRRGFKGGAAVK